MEFIIKIGNLEIYEKRLQDIFNDGFTKNILVFNGSDLKVEETFNQDASTKKCYEHILINKYDTFTLEWLYLNCKHLEKITDRTYKEKDTDDYFCKIDDTEYFKHIIKRDNMIKDLNNKTIIEY